MVKLTLILEAKNLVSGVAKKVKTQLGGLATGVSSAFGKLNKKFGSVRLGLGSITAALIGAGGVTFAFKKALGAAIDFEKGLAEIKTLGVDKSLAEIGDEVDSLSRSFGQKPQAVIRAYYDAISAGVEEANVAGFLREASTLALAGATDISVATDLLTTLRSVFGDLTDKELASFANATKNLGKTTIPELAANLGQIAPTAAAIGLSMAELSAAMAVTTVSLSDTGLATTGLRSFLSQILKPSDETQKLAKKIGVEFSIAALKTKGLSGFLGELIPKIEGNDEAIVTLFGDVRAFGVAAVLAKDGGQAFEDALAGIRTEVETGALERAAEQMKDTAAVRLDILNAELASITRTLTLQLLPAINDFAKGVVDIIKLKTGKVFEKEFAQPIKRTGAALRVLQEELKNTDKTVRAGRSGLRVANKDFLDLQSAVADAEAEFVKAATEAFPGFESRVTELASTLIREGEPTLDAFRDAVQMVGSQLGREKTALEATTAAEKKNTEAKLAATEAIREKAAAEAKAAEEERKRREEEEKKRAALPEFGPAEAGVEALAAAREQVAATTREVANLEAAFREATNPDVLSVLGEQLVRSLQAVDPELGAEAITEKFREMFPMVDFETLAQDAPFFAELLKKANPESVGEAVGAALTAAQGSIDNFTSGLTNIRNALSVLGTKGAGPFGKFAKGVAKVQAVISLAQALFEIAQAIAAVASFRFGEAAAHSAAAAAFKASEAAGKKAAGGIPGAAEGGLVPNVPGVPTNRDGVPIMAQTGELIMPQKMTEQLRALLGSIPRGGGFQVGGVVGAPGAAPPSLPQLNMTFVFERSFANAREMMREFMDVMSNEARRFGYAVNASTAEELQTEVPGGGV